jgi:hypothetical protein
MTATFFKQGLGKSQNAYSAESNRLTYPMTHAKRILSKLIDCTQSEAETILSKTYSGEWHHVGKYAVRVDYYSIPDALYHVAMMNLASLQYIFKKPNQAKCKAGQQLSRLVDSDDSGEILDSLETFISYYRRSENLLKINWSL